MARRLLDPGWNWPPAVPRDDPNYIRWLQESLNRVIQPGLEVSGVEGSKTQDAVRRFQRQQGLKVDGVVGPETESALVKAQGRSLRSSPEVPNLRPSGRLGGRARPLGTASGQIGDSAAAQLGREWLASLLRADLIYLAEAESVYYLTHDTFATALTSLSPSFKTTGGNPLYIVYADSATWRATAKSLLDTAIVCSIAGEVRSGVPQRPAKTDCSGH